MKNSVTGKVYVGATRGNHLERVRAHLGRYHMRNSQLSKDIGEYGRQNFTWGILENCSGLRQVQQAEKKHIDMIPPSLRYNRNMQGLSNLSPTRAENVRASRFGKKHAAETIEKISKSKAGVSIWPNGRPKEHLEKAIEASAEYRRKPVKCEQNGVVYRSATDAANQLGISKTSVSKIALGKRRQCKGYTFKYCGENQ